MEIKQAKAGDVIRLTEEDSFDLTVGNLYYIYKTMDESSLFFDDAGNSRAFHDHGKYEVVGQLQDFKAPVEPVPELKDIHGQTIVKGDYVAYTYAIGELRVLEVVNTNGVVADCRDILMNNMCPALGVFNERAIKLKDFAK